MTDRTIKIGKRTSEQDITIVLPNGEEILVQYRNYDKESGPSVDFILPTPMPVNCYRGTELKPAKPIKKSRNVLMADQLTLIF